MFDHVTIGVADRPASERFYRTVLPALGYEPPASGETFVEWNDFSIAPADGRPVTTGLHVAFVAPSRAAMEEFWRAGVDAGYRDDGAPGPRREYGPDYEGAFLLDPDGNSVEATFRGDAPSTDRRIDHLWVRVADLAASRRFYATVADALGFGAVEDLPGRTRCTRDSGGGSFSIVDGPATSPFHLAFEVTSHAAVEEFHSRAIRAGFADNGAPGERPEYHPGYFAAFVVDPDGHNVEAVDHGR